MDFLDKQIEPPRSWEKFEDIARALFAAVYQNPLAEKNGRRGQPQHGVDIYVERSDVPGEWVGIQCKGKDRNYGSKPTKEEFDKELTKAEQFAPSLNRWIFATTAPRDEGLQAHVRQVSKARQASGKFPVDILGWDVLQEMIAAQPSVLRTFYPEHFSSTFDAAEMLRRVSHEALDAIDDALHRADVRIVLPREKIHVVARDALGRDGIVRLTGEGGTGKSGVLKRIALMSGAPLLVFKDNRVTAATFAEHLGQLGIHDAAGALLDAFAGQGEALCVIDGADRLLMSARREFLLDVFRAIRTCGTREQWRIVTSARGYQDRDLVADALREAGFDQLGSQITIGALSDDEIAQIAKKFPRFAPLLARADLEDQTRSLFMLRDLLRRPAPPAQIPSEVDAADSWITGNGLTVTELVHRSTALAQIGTRLMTMPWDSPGRADLHPEGLHHLLHEGVVLQLPAQDAFRLGHDVHEDWLLARHLHAHRNKLTAVLQSADQPLWWLRAVQLVAQTLLEQGDQDGWLALLESLAADKKLDLAWRRAVLVAPLCSERANVILPAIEPCLIADNARLLRQLLDTLIVFETRLDDRMLAFLGDRDETTRFTMAAYFKIPVLRSWVPFLRWSLAKWDDWPRTLIPRLSELAKIFTRATSNVPNPISRRIAEIAYRWLIEIEDVRRTEKQDDRREPFDVELEEYRAWEQIEERVRGILVAAVASAPETMRAYLNRLTSKRRLGDARADLLENPGQVPSHLPREWTEMCLLQFVPPRKSRKPRDPIFGNYLFAFSDLDPTGIRRDQGFSPSSPIRGGFDQLFTADSVQALRLLHRLEHRAATHWRWHNKCSDRRKPLPVMIHLPNRTIALWGDDPVYRWARAILGSSVLGSLYLALDDWLMNQVAGGRPIGELIDQILQNNGLVATASPLIALIVDHVNSGDTIDHAGPFLAALRLWDYDARRHMDDHGLAHRIGFFSPDNIHFQAVERSHQRYRAHVPMSHALLLPFRLKASASAQAAFDALREKWSEADLAEYDHHLGDSDAQATRIGRVQRCHSDSDPKQIVFEEVDRGLQVSIAPPKEAALEIAALIAANALAEEAARLWNWVHRTREVREVSDGCTIEGAIEHARQLITKIKEEHSNPNIDYAHRLCGSAVVGTAAITAQYGSPQLIAANRTWIDDWLLGPATMQRDEEAYGGVPSPNDMQVFAAWGLAGLASRGLGSQAIDGIVAKLATHRLHAVSAGVLSGLHWKDRPEFVRAIHVAALDSCVVDFGWWWRGEKEAARARHRTAKSSARAARRALAGRHSQVPRLPPPPDSWRWVWSKERWYPQRLLMPAKRMLDWSKAQVIFKGIDWRKMTDGGVHHSAFSSYLTGLVAWTQAYSEDSDRRDRQFPYEWGHTLARELGRFAFAHGGGDEWRSLLAFDWRDRDTDLVGDYLDGAAQALMMSRTEADAGFWNAWQPAARWIIERGIVKKHGYHGELSRGLRAAGMVGPYMTPIPPDWPHLESILPAIDVWVRATAHLPTAAYASLAIVEQMDVTKRACWFLPWVTLWTETNGPDENYWSYNALGNKTAALLVPLSTQDHEQRARVRRALGILADGGATAARQLITTFAASRR